MLGEFSIWSILLVLLKLADEAQSLGKRVVKGVLVHIIRLGISRCKSIKVLFIYLFYFTFLHDNFRFPFKIYQPPQLLFFLLNY